MAYAIDEQVTGGLSIIHGETQRVPAFLVEEVNQIVKVIIWPLCVPAGPVAVGMVLQLVVEAVEDGQERLSPPAKESPEFFTHEWHHYDVKHP